MNLVYPVEAHPFLTMSDMYSKEGFRWYVVPHKAFCLVSDRVGPNKQPL